MQQKRQQRLKSNQQTKHVHLDLFNIDLQTEFLHAAMSAFSKINNVKF